MAGIYLCYIGISALLIYLVYTCVLIFLELRLISRIPGPVTYPVIGNLLDILVSTDKLWNFLRESSKKYFPVFKLVSGHRSGVFIVDPDDIQNILTSPIFLSKNEIYTGLSQWLGTGLLLSTGKKWHFRRKLLTSSFHFTILQHFIKVFIDQSQLLTKRLDKECDQTRTNIAPILSEFTLKTICASAMGTQIDNNAKDSLPIMKSVHRIGELIFHQIVRPWLYAPFIYALTPQSREKSAIIKYLHNFTMNVIQQKKQNYKLGSVLQKHDDDGRKNRLAMLDVLLLEQMQGANVDDEGIREEVETFMFEGHDTTATCLSFTLMLLANNRDVQDKVYQELVEVFENFQKEPSYNDIQNLTYLEMVIKESLRMYPSVPIIGRVPEETFKTKSGYVIPKGAQLFLMIYDLHHNADFFPEPNKFDPLRFSPENVRHTFAYIPFSGGQRNCIGQKFAMIELKVALSYILKNFYLEPIDRPENLVLYSDLLIRSKNGINIKLCRR